MVSTAICEGKFAACHTSFQPLPEACTPVSAQRRLAGHGVKQGTEACEDTPPIHAPANCSSCCCSPADVWRVKLYPQGWGPRMPKPASKPGRGAPVLGSRVQAGKGKQPCKPVKSVCVLADEWQRAGVVQRACSRQPRSPDKLLHQRLHAALMHTTCLCNLLWPIMYLC